MVALLPTDLGCRTVGVVRKYSTRLWGCDPVLRGQEEEVILEMPYTHFLIYPSHFKCRAEIA